MNLGLKTLCLGYTGRQIKKNQLHFTLITLDYLALNS